MIFLPRTLGHNLPINPIDAGALVVASQQEKVLRILYFVGKQQTDRLQWLFASVHVVAQEQVIRVRREVSVLKQAQQVIILSMDITCKRLTCTELISIVSMINAL